MWVRIRRASRAAPRQVDDHGWASRKSTQVFGLSPELLRREDTQDDKSHQRNELGDREGRRSQIFEGGNLLKRLSDQNKEIEIESAVTAVMT